MNTQRIEPDPFSYPADLVSEMGSHICAKYKTKTLYICNLCGIHCVLNATGSQSWHRHFAPFRTKSYECNFQK